METFDSVKDFWQNTNQPQAQPLAKETLEDVVNLRLKREKKKVTQYFWVSFIFQNVVYAFACHLFIRYWGDRQIMLLSGLGALIYIPFTVVLMQKFKRFFKSSSLKEATIHTSVKNQYKALNQFYTFKKWFDLLFIPLNAVILTGIIFKLYVPGGFGTHILGALIVAISTVCLYATAAWFENKKHFVKPLKRFRYILEDMERKE